MSGVPSVNREISEAVSAPGRELQHNHSTQSNPWQALLERSATHHDLLLPDLNEATATLLIMTPHDYQSLLLTAWSMCV